MEIIKDVYLFFFVVILPHKLDNKDQINKLYSVYFGKVSEMYSYLASDSLTNTQPFNLDNIQQSVIYKNYVQSKGLNISEKVLAVKKICKRINLEYDLNNLLDLLWGKNIESVMLLYGLKDGSIDNLLLTEKDPNIHGITEIDTVRVLEKTHNYFEDLIKDGGISKIESLIP